MDRRGAARRRGFKSTDLSVARKVPHNRSGRIVNVLEHKRRRNPQRPNPALQQPGVPALVPQRPVSEIVAAPVHFYRQFSESQ